MTGFFVVVFTLVLFILLKEEVIDKRNLGEEVIVEVTDKSTKRVYRQGRYRTDYYLTVQAVNSDHWLQQGEAEVSRGSYNKVDYGNRILVTAVDKRKDGGNRVKIHLGYKNRIFDKVIFEQELGKQH